MPTIRILDTVVVVQKNKTRHLINWLQIQQFAHINNQDILIFLAKYYWIKKDNRNLIQNELFFETQDGKSNWIEPDLFFYCGKVFTNLLVN